MKVMTVKVKRGLLATDDKQLCISDMEAMTLEENTAGRKISNMRQMILVAVLGKKWDTRLKIR